MSNSFWGNLHRQFNSTSYLSRPNKYSSERFARPKEELKVTNGLASVTSLQRCFTSNHWYQDSETEQS